MICLSKKKELCFLILKWASTIRLLDTHSFRFERIIGFRDSHHNKTAEHSSCLSILCCIRMVVRGRLIRSFCPNRLRRKVMDMPLQDSNPVFRRRRESSFGFFFFFFFSSFFFSSSSSFFFFFFLFFFSSSSSSSPTLPSNVGVAVIWFLFGEKSTNSCSETFAVVFGGKKLWERTN